MKTLKVDSDHSIPDQMFNNKTKRHSVQLKYPSKINEDWNEINQTIQQRVQKLNKKFHKNVEVDLVVPNQVDRVIEQSESEEVIVENNNQEVRERRRVTRRQRRFERIRVQSNQEPRVNQTHRRIIRIRNRQQLEAFLLSIIYVIFVCCVSIVIALVFILVLI